MKKSYVLIILAVIVSAVGLWYMFRGMTTASSDATNANPLTLSGQGEVGTKTATMKQNASSIDSDKAAPEWAKDQLEPKVSVQTDAGAETRQAGLKAALERFERMQKAGVSDPLQVANALAQLEKANGSPLMSGIRLDILRHNLEVSDKMRVIAEDLQSTNASATANTTPTKDQLATLKTKTDQLQALQKQMRMDFRQDSPVPSTAH